MKAIDLYSGIGGWTIGFKLAGINMAASFEWWKDANNTHNKNFNTNHKEINIRELDLSTLPKPGTVQFVVGSPPCTQFSYANRGGQGDIKDGLVDIRKFLEVVEYLQPKYWAMENVPRVSAILEKQIKSGSLRKFKHLFTGIKVYNAADFGVPQDRKRMIAGNLPFDLLDSYKTKTTRITLGEVLASLKLNKESVVDPVYKFSLPTALLSDYESELPLSAEETRINLSAKSFHPVYNKMSFPDKEDRPSRTVTALCTRVSRESIIVKDRNNFRRLSIRERGCLQSFPISYQFYSKTSGGKIKMIGNAVPPLLTFYIAQAMLETPINKLLVPPNIPSERFKFSPELSPAHKPEKEGNKYSFNRSFWFAIPNLRFGSGIRFELKNSADKKTNKIRWGINFFYGSSKKIKQLPLDYQLLDEALMILPPKVSKSVKSNLKKYEQLMEAVDFDGLQKNWVNIDKSANSPFSLIDNVGEYVPELKQALENDFALVSNFVVSKLINSEGRMDNKKLSEISLDVYVGFILGSIFNLMAEGRTISLEKKKVTLV